MLAKQLREEIAQREEKEKLEKIEAQKLAEQRQKAYVKECLEKYDKFINIIINQIKFNNTGSFIIDSEREWTKKLDFSSKIIMEHKLDDIAEWAKSQGFLVTCQKSVEIGRNSSYITTADGYDIIDEGPIYGPRITLKW